MKWINCRERMPKPHVPVALLNVNRFMAYEPYGNWKGVGVLDGVRLWRGYWSVIGESGAIPLESITHWCELPEDISTYEFLPVCQDCGVRVDDSETHCYDCIQKEKDGLL